MEVFGPMSHKETGCVVRYVKIRKCLFSLKGNWNGKERLCSFKKQIFVELVFIL